MRAAHYREHGEPGVLTVGEVPTPHAGPGTVRIRVAAASVNVIDWLLRAGALAEAFPLPFPVVPGRDAAGVVDEIGEGVTGVELGDRVFGLGGVSDTTGEWAVLSAWAPTPEGWSDAEAAAAGLSSATAASALDVLAASREGGLDGAVLFVDGASGAVGSAAAALALAAGATVIGSGGAANQEHLRAIDVVPVLYGEGMTERVRELAPGGVDLVLDAAASGALPELVALAGDPDRVVTVVGQDAAGALGVRLANATNDSEFLRRAAALGRDGRYTPRVSATVPLDEVARAHTVAEERGGKVVVLIGD